jgi:hypothetical protein
MGYSGEPIPLLPVNTGGGGREIGSLRARFHAPTIIKQKNPTSAARFAYEHPDLDDHVDGRPESDPHLSADLMLAERIARHIERHYPGHLFEVLVEHATGTVQIRHPLMGSLNCFVCHTSQLDGDTRLHQITIACGEVLERYKIGRAGFAHDDVSAAMLSKPLIFRKDAPVAE